MNNDYPINDRNKVKRIPKRGHYDKATVYKILDAAFLCHVGFTIDGQPFVVPTAYGRKENTIFLHGATTSRMMVAAKAGIPLCITVTHLDGIVLARSAFNHSMNYRSAILFGKGYEVADTDKEETLYIISENIIKDRWQESRLPTAKELKATTVIAMDIEQASAKIRTGDPGDDKPDYALPIWAGVIPLETHVGEIIPDPVLREDIPTAPSALNYDKNRFNPK